MMIEIFLKCFFFILVPKHKYNFFSLPVVNLALSEDQYSKAEGYGSFTVVVRQLEPRKTLDSDIVLRLIPVNYTYANNSGFYTCDEIPFDEDVPNRAVGKSIMILKINLNAQIHNLCISIII